LLFFAQIKDSGFLKLQRFLDKQTCQDAARQRNNKRYVNEDIHPPINRIDKLHPDEKNEASSVTSRPTEEQIAGI